MTALITGATAGIGRAFAEILAEEGSDLVLVARDRARLEELATDLSDEGRIDVEVIDADLGSDSGSAQVMARLADPDRPVDVLVNNAGFGLNQPFIGGGLADEEQLLDVLVRATLRLTHAALPGMVDRGTGMVLNVSSIAGWVPSGTYGAAKAWVTTFTEGLTGELAGTGVSATAVCPGFTRTEFHERARMEVGDLPGWAWLDAQRVAREGLSDARAGRAVSVPSTRYSAVSMVAQYVPRPLVRRVTTVATRQRIQRP
jgi:short-subunit dehydrogenase